MARGVSAPSGREAMRSSHQGERGGCKGVQVRTKGEQGAGTQRRPHTEAVTLVPTTQRLNQGFAAREARGVQALVPTWRTHVATCADSDGLGL